MLKLKDPDYSKIVEGNYTYYQDDKPYSEESFIVYQHPDNDSYLFMTEVISRLESGELLRINTSYELSSSYIPIDVVVEKRVGTKIVTETYKYVRIDHKVTYVFSSDEENKGMDKDVPGNFSISTPSFSTSTLCLLQRSLNALGRTKYNMLLSPNDWSVKGKITDDGVYFEQKASGNQKLMVKGKELEGKIYRMYKYDITENKKEDPIEFFCSKHFNIPYQVLIPGGVRIEVNKLKRFDLAVLEDEVEG
jgi:hypothetical protein